MSGISKTNGVALAVASLAAVAVYRLSTSVFRYHSTNHDEGVYLQQASMLLDGRLSTRAPTVELTEAFRPWFFVVEGAKMYPKYSPAPAAVFALGDLVGGFRVSLAVVAFCNVVLVYLVVREGFDGTVGVVSSVVLVLSPFFLVNTSLFLPYATTALFNLLFALGYVRGFVREDVSLGYAALAGVGVGLSFFSRPYTAVLFASPFVAHAAHSLLARLRNEEGGFGRRLVGYSVLSVVGLFFVGVTLAYNAVVTGSPFAFPYLEFAPLDGLGFGRRKILGYERVYTPRLGIRANAYALWRLASDWTTAGILGSSLAAVGGGLALYEADGRERTVRLLLVGVFVAFVVGNVYFWGTLNILGEIGDPTDGLVNLYGPYYHYDTLLPVSAFMSFGLVSAYRRLKSSSASVSAASAPALAVALVAALAFGGVAVAEVDEKVERNSEITDVYEKAYQPFEEREFEDALVLLPTPYGDWLNHPFQYLRNEPGLDGEVVYAIDRGPDNFDVFDAYPNRTYYRYSYRGEWEPYTGSAVEPTLDRVETVEGGSVRLSTAVDADEDSTVSVSLRSGGEPVLYTESVNGTFETDIVVSAGAGKETGTEDTTARAYPESRPGSSVSVRERGEIEVTVRVVRGYLDEETYRQTFPVEVSDGVVRVASPEVRYCPSPTVCGEGAAYVSVPEDGGMRTELSTVSDAPGAGP